MTTTSPYANDLDSTEWHTLWFTSQSFWHNFPQAKEEEERRDDRWLFLSFHNTTETPRPTSEEEVFYLVQSDNSRVSLICLLEAAYPAYLVFESLLYNAMFFLCCCILRLHCNPNLPTFPIFAISLPSPGFLIFLPHFWQIQIYSRLFPLWL